MFRALYLNQWPVFSNQLFWHIQIQLVLLISWKRPAPFPYGVCSHAHTHSHIPGLAMPDDSEILGKPFLEAKDYNTAGMG